MRLCRPGVFSKYCEAVIASLEVRVCKVVKRVRIESLVRSVPTFRRFLGLEGMDGRICWTYLSVFIFGVLGICWGQPMSCDRMTACSCQGKNFSSIDIEAVLKQTM